nr:hypothetical protein [Tanacetum cinerariifolium]
GCPGALPEKPAGQENCLRQSAEDVWARTGRAGRRGPAAGCGWKNCRSSKSLIELASVDKCPNTPKGTPVDATGCPLVTPAPEPAVAPVVLPKEEVITIRDVHFEFNKATLTPGDKQQLDMVATKLKTEAPNVQMHVSGHTDSVGSDAYNQKLSEKRAHSVTDYLVSAGIPRSAFVSVEGDGEARPVADNKTAEGRALNRRVEIKLNR